LAESSPADGDYEFHYRAIGTVEEEGKNVSTRWDFVPFLFAMESWTQ